MSITNCKRPLLFILHLCIIMYSAPTSPPVSLSSTLFNGDFALSGQRLVFTCIIQNASILEWQCYDYIGWNDIQIYNFSIGGRDNVSSVSDPNVYAIRVRPSMEDGVTVIVSQLFITASERFPTSSVTCRKYGQGSQETIFFNTTSMELQDVTLNCEQSPLPEQKVVFTCITRGTDILIWESEYIGANGLDIIRIHGTGERNNVTSTSINTTYATRVNVTVEDGVPVIVSQLFITASEQFPNSSVTCRIDHNGPGQTIYFNTTGAKTCEATTAYTNVTVTVNKTVIDDQDSKQNTSRTTIAAAVTCSILAVIIIIALMLIIIGLVCGFRKSAKCIESPPASNLLEEGVHKNDVES